MSNPEPNPCTICKGTGYRPVPGGVVQCDCVKLKIAMKYLSQLDPSLRRCELSTLAHAFESVREWQQTAPFQARYQPQVSEEPAASYFMCGPLDVGKTWLAAAQFVHLSKNKTRCFWRTAAKFCDELQLHYAGRDDQFQESPILLAAKAYDYIHVFIDDVDKMSFTRTDFRRERAYDFFNMMLTKEFGLTLTSNHDYIGLQKEDLLPPAVVRRISDICIPLELNQGAQ